MNDLVSKSDVIQLIHQYFWERIEQSPKEISGDGEEVYTDTETVNLWLTCNKELSKAVKALPEAEMSANKERSNSEINDCNN